MFQQDRNPEEIRERTIPPTADSSNAAAAWVEQQPLWGMGRDVADAADFDAGGGEGGGWRTRGRSRDRKTRTSTERTPCVVAKPALASTDGRLLRREQEIPLAGAAEAERAGGLPGERIADLVGDGDDGVVERSLDEDGGPNGTFLRSRFLNFLFLPRA